MLDKIGYVFPHKKDNVPVLSLSNIEDLTSMIVADYNSELLETPTPFDVDDFIEFYLEYNIEEVHLSKNQCYLGRCVFNDSDVIPIYLPEKDDVTWLTNRSKTILLDARLSEQPNMNHLRRFTLMHEAGHAVQHQKYYSDTQNQLALFDVDDYTSENLNKNASSRPENVLTFGEGRRLVTEEDWLEYQANTFASYMLMNKRSFSKFLENQSYSKSCSRLQRLLIIQEISSVYQVSNDAAAIRLSIHDKQLENEQQVSLF